VSRSLWRCRNRRCPVPHGAVLGRVTAEGGLVLDPWVKQFLVVLATRRITVWCPACGHPRDFHGPMVRRQEGRSA
jgi:hypothetical protein